MLNFSSPYSQYYDLLCAGQEHSKMKKSIKRTILVALILSSQTLFAQTAEQSPQERECDAVFNPSKRFCYDGEVYDKCDDMPYNPSTHICSGEIAKRAICNGVQYNPLIQKCESNIPKTAEEETHTEVTAAEQEPVVQAKIEEPEIEKPEQKLDEPKKSILSLGFRAGFNFSHLYESYEYYGRKNSGSMNSTPGFQAGLVFDIAASDLFHFRPGLVYIQKGAEQRGNTLTLHYIEFPILASLKLSYIMVNAGPYFNILTGTSKGNYERYDFGFSYGGGFDIGGFGIGVFYDYGLANVNKRSNYETYNRSFGFNLEYNL